MYDIADPTPAADTMGITQCVARLTGRAFEVDYPYADVLNLCVGGRATRPSDAPQGHGHMPFPVQGLSTSDTTGAHRVVIAVLAVLRNLVLLPSNIEVRASLACRMQRGEGLRAVF